MTRGPRWQVHATVPCSRANGPGRRYVIWSQGCTLNCPGCFNPATHPPTGTGAGRGAGSAVEVASLVTQVLTSDPDLDGVTVTGGEPLQQPGPVAAFCRQLRAQSRLGIILYTGYTRTEVTADPERLAAVADVDLVVAGRYLRHQHLGHGLRGSANQELWARTDRYTADDLAQVPEVEVLLTPDGSTTVTGLAGAGPAPTAPVPALPHTATGGSGSHEAAAW